MAESNTVPEHENASPPTLLAWDKVDEHDGTPSSLDHPDGNDNFDGPFYQPDAKPPSSDVLTNQPYAGTTGAEPAISDTGEPDSPAQPSQAAAAPAPANRPSQEGLQKTDQPTLASETKATPTKFPFIPLRITGNKKVTQKLGIIGGKGVGKSYLFQSMVYRSYHADKSGALAYYLDQSGIELHSSAAHSVHQERREPLSSFVDDYKSWNTLVQTRLYDQRWYRLSLPYLTGYLGRGRAVLDVKFFDGSGEGLIALESMDDAQQQLWKDAYLDCTVMVFCLPLWAVFPNADAMSGKTPTSRTQSPAAGGDGNEQEELDDWDRRDRFLRQFEQVVTNFRVLRKKFHIRHRVRCILALTMADDPRCALTTLSNRWIAKYMNNPDHYLTSLRKGKNIARYLANARRVSESLYAEFRSHTDPTIGAIPGLLWGFHGGRPWLIPLSAIEGEWLKQPPTDRLPVPVHVELPLLVALCESENALM
jgi:hypothetical protein